MSIRRIQQNFWMLSTIVIGLVLFLLTLIVWDEREFLIQRTAESSKVRDLNVKAFNEQIISTLPISGAQVGILWSIDLTKNVRQTLSFYSDEGTNKNFVRRRAPIFTNIHQENEFVIHLLNGETFCGSLLTRSSIGQKLLRDKIIFLCRSPITTSKGLLIGYITLGFSERPNDAKREAAAKTMMDLASVLPIQK